MRRQVDVSNRYRFDPEASQPDERRIEQTTLDPVPDDVTDREKKTVAREPYIAGPRLADAVNVAIALGRPLLVQGDPGAGKTQLAHAVAYALGLPLEEMYVKSTTRAQDLLYTYDAVRRLYDAQLKPEAGGDSPAEVERYVRLEPLGRAIVRAEKGRRSVVLIDEIDKADIDFPNDLLREVDQLAFDITELRKRHTVPSDRPDLRPIIIVTNNEEKVLPDAFLRRCVFYYIETPTDPAALDAILSAHEIPDEQLRATAIDVLTRLRRLKLIKRPGVSELLDWAGYLHAVKTPPPEVATQALGDLPNLGTLLKVQADLERVETEPGPAA
jgi:MoxR-like ATPase